MISFGPQVRVFVATQPIDFRTGVHGLVALVAHGLHADPYLCGDVFVFRSKRPDRLKLLAFDGTGMILATKWLEGGKFVWPPIREGKMMLSATQLAMLLEGLSEWLKIAPRPAKKLIKTA
jgi:transposase